MHAVKSHYGHLPLTTYDARYPVIQTRTKEKGTTVKLECGTTIFRKKKKLGT